MTEVWKSIEGYGNYYQISDQGNVRSLDRVISFKYDNRDKKVKRKLHGMNIAKHLSSTGYWLVDLNFNGKKYTKKVHRLVAQAFIPRPENKNIVNHIDGNPLNNNVSNLEWSTQSENVKDAYRTGLHKSNAWKFRKEIASDYSRNSDMTINELSRKYSANVKTVRQIIVESGLKVKTISEAQTKYKIDKKKLIEDFNNVKSNVELAKKYHTNRHLIANYRNKAKKGILI